MGTIFLTSSSCTAEINEISSNFESYTPVETVGISNELDSISDVEMIVTKENFSEIFGDDPLKESADEQFRGESYYKTLKYDGIIWSAETGDGIIYDEIPNCGDFFYGMAMEQSVRQGLISDEDIIGISVDSIYSPATLTEEYIISTFEKYGFTRDFTNDEVVLFRMNELLERKNSRNFNRGGEDYGRVTYHIFVGTFGGLKEKLADLGEDEAYIIGHAPFFYGIYADEAKPFSLELTLNDGEIYIDDELADVIFDENARTDGIYHIAVRYHNLESKDYDENDVHDYLNSYDFPSFEAYNEHKAYLEENGFDALIRGNFAMIRDFIGKNLSSEFAFSLYLAPYIG